MRKEAELLEGLLKDFFNVEFVKKLNFFRNNI